MTPLEEAELWVAKRGYVTKPFKGYCHHATVCPNGKRVRAFTRRNLVPLVAHQIELHRAQLMRDAINRSGE